MDSVCVSCKGLQKHLLGNTPVSENGSLQWVNTSLPRLRASAENCPACKLLLNGILFHHDRFANIRETRIRIRAESFLSASGRISQDHLSLELRWKESDPHVDQGHDDDEHAAYPDLKLEYFTDSNGVPSFSAIGQGRHTSESPLQGSGLAKVRSMLQKCYGHPKCNPSRSTNLPRRILDVSSSAELQIVLLHESKWDEQEQKYERDQYVALSHVWGFGKGPKTTRANLQSHVAGIALSSLPQSYQEAIRLTRELGFRYLWIDALCLIQDDVEAKLEESLTMDDIFGNATLTIAATSAADSSTQPLFPSKAPVFHMQATGNQGHVSKVYVREQPSHYSFKAPFDEGSHMNDWELPFNTSPEANRYTPLLKRAWTYAERMLSPRVLHFTRSEMIWECREGYDCECGRIDDSVFDPRTTDSFKQEFGRIIAEANVRPVTNGNSNSTNDRRPENMTGQPASTILSIGSQDALRRRGEALQLWSYLITEFTARNMTYDERLIAITGIARALKPAMQSGYIAGQWTFSTFSLLWYPTDSAKCRRPKLADGYNTPTWSWASCEGSPILFDNTYALDLACRASFGLKGKRASAWSPIQGEPLNLSASMAAEVTFHCSQGNYALAKNGITVEFTPDIVPPRGDDMLRDGDILVCVFVSMSWRSSILGLVLRSCGNNTFRRVGRLECEECTPEGHDEEMSEDAESLFGYWFPEIPDMTLLESAPQRHLIVV